VKIDELEIEELPTELQGLEVADQIQRIERLADTRKDLQRQILELSDKRKSYISKEVAKASETSAESLDNKLYEAVREQGAKVGLKYNSGPGY